MRTKIKLIRLRSSLIFIKKELGNPNITFKKLIKRFKKL